jgi:hypothetical protein
MGKYFADQFSLLHFAVGIMVYFWSVPLIAWIGLHILFELIENSDWGMNIINNWLKIWPGGKPYADTPLNMVGDTVFAALGWILAYYLDIYGAHAGWYSGHLG